MEESSALAELQEGAHRAAASPTAGANFASGTAAGIALVIVGHPFDTLKVRLQTQGPVRQYRNALDCLCKIIRREGLLGVYKGVSSPLLGISFCNAVLFTSNGFFKDLLRTPGEDRLSLAKVAAAGSMAGVVMAFVNCPIELVKVRLQIQDPSKPKLYGSVFDCAAKTVQATGWRGLFRGLSATLWRDTPSFAAYFGAYEAAKLALAACNSEAADEAPQEAGVLGRLSLGQQLLAGGLAGIAAWLPCYPQDVVKSQMQSSGAFGSTRECMRSIYATHSLAGFFKGFGPTMARAFPANAATLLAYEVVQAAFA